jgi:hypothetical protein
MTMMDGFGFSVGVWIGLDGMGGENKPSLCILETNPAFLDLKCIVINSTKIKHNQNTSKSEPPSKINFSSGLHLLA